MGNFFPTTANNVDGSTYQTVKDGLLLTKWNAGAPFWHASIKGTHVCGSAYNRPMLVSQGDNKPYVAPLGLSVPVTAPNVQIFSSGTIDGAVQLGMRKFNSKTGCASDFTPIWPPAGIEVAVALPDVGERATINLNRAADSPVNTAIAQKFTVPSTIATASGGNSSAPIPATSRLTYQSVTLQMKLVGTPAAGDAVKVVIYAADASGMPSQRTAESELVALSSLSTATWGASVTFNFVEDLLLTPAAVFFIGIVPDYTAGTVYAQVVVDNTSSAGAASDIKLLQSGAWANYSDADSDIVFSLNPSSAQRGHFNYVDLTGKYVNITNLDTVAADAVYEDYDCVQVMVVSTLTDGEWKILRTMPIDTDVPASTDGNFAINQAIANASVLNQPSVLPFFNRPFGGMQQIISYQEGEQQRLVGFGMPGWDNWKDAPIAVRATVTSLIRGDDVGSGNDIPQWVIGSYNFETSTWTSATSYATPSAADGYLVTIFKTETASQEDGGVEIMRGVLNWNAAESVLEVLNARGQGLEYRNTTYLRMEIRRQVLASVTKGSTLVQLFYENGTTPAYQADQWMVNHTLKLMGQDAPPVTVLKCQKKSSANPVPYVSRKYFPSNELYLETAWKGTTGTGQLGLVEDRNTIMFGGGRDDEYQGTSPKLWLTLDNTRPVMAIGACKGLLIALTKGTELFKINVGNIVTPNTVEALAGFGITSAVETERMLLNYTCIGWTGTVTDHNGDLYCIGGEGIYRFDLNSMNCITNNVVSDRFKSYGTKTKQTAWAVLDPGMRFETAIRFGGFFIGDEFRQPTPRTDTYMDLYRQYDFLTDQLVAPTYSFTWKDFRLRKDVQMVYLTGRNGWVSVDKQMAMDSGCTALDDQGRYRVMIGGEGRIWMYGPSAVDGSTSDDACYTIARVAGEEVYVEGKAAADFTSVAPYTVEFGLDEITRGSEWMWAARAGVFLYKISDDGTTEKAEILFPTTNDGDGPVFLLKPNTTWTITTGATYDVILGGREWAVTLPAIVPSNINGSVDWRAFKLAINDNGSGTFEWPLQVHPFRSSGAGSANLAAQDIYNYTRTDFQDNRFQHNFMLDQPSYEFYPRFFGVAPPDSHMTFERLGIIYWEHGG